MRHLKIIIILIKLHIYNLNKLNNNSMINYNRDNKVVNCQIYPKYKVNSLHHRQALKVHSLNNYNQTQSLLMKIIKAGLLKY